MEYWQLSDDELLKQCDWKAGRTGGPGGQARNKTHSAIDIVHRPTGIGAFARESRLQGENRALALKRLRYALALHLRRPVDLAHFTPPAAVAAQINRDGKLKVSPENPRYLDVLATLLDLLEAAGGHVAPAAAALGITTTNFINLLHRDPKLWTAALALRARCGLGPLKA
ncbi:MAG TPA: peptide chain release factor-like protein [Armatimonadota bacterium]|nr:peptide chain release factor-like protein [Armatimonadota bacterium]